MRSDVFVFARQDNGGHQAALDWPCLQLCSATTGVAYNAETSFNDHTDGNKTQNERRHCTLYSS